MILALIIALVLLFSVRRVFFMKAQEREMIFVPVSAHLVVDDSGYYTSARNEQEVITLVDMANKIWSQAGIAFSLERVETTHLSFATIPDAINNNVSEISLYVQGKGVHLFFTQSLNGLNGLTLKDINTVLIADDSRAQGYRTVAHELGHVLGLKHVSFPQSLMAQGERGELLSEEEIVAAREAAKKLG